MPLVLHNSDVSGWALQNQATPYSQAIAERLKDDRAKVPALWELELSNVLRSACVRQRLHAQAAQQVLIHLGTLPIEIDRHPVPRSELLALALRFGLPAMTPATWSWPCARSGRWPPRTRPCVTPQWPAAWASWRRLPPPDSSHRHAAAVWRGAGGHDRPGPC